jgi:hypothetical protein
VDYLAWFQDAVEKLRKGERDKQHYNKFVARSSSIVAAVEVQKV